MGADITVHPRGVRAGEPVCDVEVRAAPLRGTVIRSQESIVDELPVLAIAAAFADGPSEIVDAGELRVKESDRIASLAAELAKLGAPVVLRDDDLLIEGTGGALSGAIAFESHGDHRIAMAGAVAAVAIPGESIVEGWDDVEISYPEFAADLVTVGGRIA
jgi:3-phosphoshikimate 1-carboxyvinyltransferase